MVMKWYGYILIVLIQYIIAWRKYGIYKYNSYNNIAPLDSAFVLKTAIGFLISISNKLQYSQHFKFSVSNTLRVGTGIMHNIGQALYI